MNKVKESKRTKPVNLFQILSSQKTAMESAVKTEKNAKTIKQCI